MGRINCVQGSPEWHALRATKISATMSSSICGCNPYKSALQLFEELTGIREPDAPNEKMRRGSELESVGRDLFMKQTGFHVEPAVFVSDTHPWAMASLDGITEDGKIAVEIKCGEKAYNDLVKDKIAPYYYAQIQHQMWVARLDLIYYCCFSEKREKFLKKLVIRDDDLINDMILKLQKFYDDWQLLIPPKSPESPIWEIPYEDYVAECDKFAKEMYETLKENDA